MSEYKIKYYKILSYFLGIGFIITSGCKSKSSTTTDAPEITPIDSVITKNDSTIKKNDTLVIAPNKKKKKDIIIKPQVIQVIHNVQAEYGVRPNVYEKNEQPTNE